MCGDPSMVADRFSTGLGRTWPEFEGGGVDAIPEPGRLGAVVEHVSQVRTAVRALDLGPPHEQAAIFFVPHASFLGRRPEARPARPGVELGLRGKELLPADDAHVHTGLVVVPVFSRIGTFGPLVDAHLILQRCELFSKLRSVEFLHEDKCVRGRFKVLAARCSSDSHSSKGWPERAAVERRVTQCFSWKVDAGRGLPCKNTISSSLAPGPG